jgi:hypothetical protein
MSIFWIAQAIGAVGFLFSVLSYNSKTRNAMLAHQSSGSLVYMFHYLLLAGWTGAAMELLVVARNWVFLKKETHAWAGNIRWMYFFMGLTFLLLFFTWQGPISLLPVMGILLGVYTRWHHGPAKIRLFSLVGVILWIPYNIYIQSIAATISGMVMGVIIVIAMIRHDRHVKWKDDIQGV